MDVFTFLPIHLNNVLLPPLEGQISEVERNVKGLKKNINELNNSSCCQLCSEKSFQEIVDKSKLVDQKIQAIQKRILSPKQKASLDRLNQKFMQQSVLIPQLSDRKFASLPLVCFPGFIKECFLSRKHSWTKILPYVAMFGIGATVSRPFGIGILAGVVTYTFATTARFFCLKCLSPFPSTVESKCNKNSSRMFIDVCLLPWNEECVFRGVLQNVVCYFTKSSLAGIAVSAGMFGAYHLTNHHPRRWELVFQVINTGLNIGVVCGILNHQLGLAASIGAHAMNNFLACK